MDKEKIVIRIEEWKNGFTAVRYIDGVPYVISKAWHSAISLYEYLILDCKIDPSRIEMEE
jgi:hypothetical protein